MCDWYEVFFIHRTIYYIVNEFKSATHFFLCLQYVSWTLSCLEGDKPCYHINGLPMISRHCKERMGCDALWNCDTIIKVLKSCCVLMRWQLVCDWFVRGSNLVEVREAQISIKVLFLAQVTIHISQLTGLRYPTAV